MSVNTTSSRLHGLDTLRAAALGLGIILHSLLPFTEMPWLFTDVQTTVIAAPTIYWIHLFRMVLFMLLAGFFGHMILHRRGTRPYVRDRLLRIGLPAIVFIPLTVLPLGVMFVLHVQARGLPMPEPPPSTGPVADVLSALNPGHLWFLWVLIYSVLIVVFVRFLLVRLFGAERVATVGRRAGSMLSSPAGVVLAALPYLVGLLLQGEEYVHGILEPGTIIPLPNSMIPYLGAFAVGWLLHAAPGALERLVRQWPWHGAVAIVTTVAAYVIEVGQIPVVLHAVLVALAGWTWTYGLIGLCMTFLRRENPAMRYLADSSYWSYLLHLPIVVGLGMLLAGLEWPVLLKLLITWTVTGVILLVTYDLLVRGTWVGRWLNGRRRPLVILPSARQVLSREG